MMSQDDQPAGQNQGDARRGDAAEPELPEVAMDTLVEQPEGGYRSEREPPGERARVLRLLDAGTVVMQFDTEYRLVAEDSEERVELLGVDIEQRVVSPGLCQTYSRIRGNRWMCTRYRVEAHYELILTRWRPPDKVLRWSPEPTPDPVLGTQIPASSIARMWPEIRRSHSVFFDWLDGPTGSTEVFAKDSMKTISSGWMAIATTLGERTLVEGADDEEWIPIGQIYPCGEDGARGAPGLEFGVRLNEPGNYCEDIKKELANARAEYDHASGLLDWDGSSDEFESMTRKLKDSIAELRWKRDACEAACLPTGEVSVSEVIGRFQAVDDDHLDPALGDTGDRIRHSDYGVRWPNRFAFGACTDCRGLEILVSYLEVEHEMITDRLDDGEESVVSRYPEWLAERNEMWRETLDVYDKRILWAKELRDRCEDEFCKSPRAGKPWAERGVLVRPETVKLLSDNLANDGGSVDGIPKAPMSDEMGESWPRLGCTGFFLIVLAIGSAAAGGLYVWSTDSGSGSESSIVATEVSEAGPASTGPETSDSAPSELTSSANPTTSGAPTPTVDQPNLFDVLRLFGIPTASLQALADTQSVDPAGGINYDDERPIGQNRESSSIVATLALLALLDAALLDAGFNNSSFPCGGETDSYRSTCVEGAGLFAEGEYIIVAVKLEGPIDDSDVQLTYGLAFDDDGDDTDNYQFTPPREVDFFRNTEHWYRLQIDPDGTRQMWADGFRDGVRNYPRYSSAVVVEYGDTLVWVIPRTELPGDQLAYRATAFHNSGDLTKPPDAASAGGDVSGLGVLEPLLAVGGPVITFNELSSLPPDIEGTSKRVPVTDDPDRQIAQALIEEFSARLNRALAEGDADAVLATVLPELLNGPQGDECRAEIDATIALAESVIFTDLPGGPDTSSQLPIYIPTAQIVYPTGSVEWGPLLIPGPGGRLFLLLPSCVPT